MVVGRGPPLAPTPCRASNPLRHLRCHSMVDYLLATSGVFFPVIYDLLVNSFPRLAERNKVSGREPYPGRPSQRTLQVPAASPGGSPSNIVLYYDETAPPPTPVLASKRDSLPVAQVSSFISLKTI